MNKRKGNGFEFIDKVEDQCIYKFLSTRSPDREVSSRESNDSACYVLALKILKELQRIREINTEQNTSDSAVRS